MSNSTHTDVRTWILAQGSQGATPDNILEQLIRAGWTASQAQAALDAVLREALDHHAGGAGLPEAIAVPAPFPADGPSLIDIDGHVVQVLARLAKPCVVALGHVLTDEECEQLIELARPRLHRSRVVDPDSGDESLHGARTSDGMSFSRGANALCERIERRLAKLLQWPLENGEGLQVLRYGIGNEYLPHYDYFDPEQPGSQLVLERGGQRVATLVMYLNTPLRGGATTFPEAGFEAAAQRGNAVFFSYDRPHPMTGSLHGGAPVLEGEKWVATKWLRERPHS